MPPCIRMCVHVRSKDDSQCGVPNDVLLLPPAAPAHGQPTDLIVHSNIGLLSAFVNIMSMLSCMQSLGMGGKCHCCQPCRAVSAGQDIEMSSSTRLRRSAFVPKQCGSRAVIGALTPANYVRRVQAGFRGRKIAAFFGKSLASSEKSSCPITFGKVTSAQLIGPGQLLGAFLDDGKTQR